MILFDDVEENGQIIPLGNNVLLLYHDTGGLVEEIYNLTWNSTTETWNTASYDTITTL